MPTILYTLLLGCTLGESAYNRQAWVVEHVPVGTPVARAVEIMKGQGFECGGETDGSRAVGSYFENGIREGRGNMAGDPRAPAGPHLGCAREAFPVRVYVYIATADGRVGYGDRLQIGDFPGSHVAVDTGGPL